MKSRPIETFSAALAGGCFVAFTQILTRDSLPPLLKVAVGLFSLAIPFLVVFAFVEVPGDPFRDLRWFEKLTWLLFIVSGVSGLLGIACVFWFVRPLFGGAFALSSLGAYGFLQLRARV